VCYLAYGLELLQDAVMLFNSRMRRRPLVGVCLERRESQAVDHGGGDLSSLAHGMGW